MKANELRIGNLIEYNNEVITVSGIKGNSIYYGDGWFDSNTGDYQPFRPIPLTEKILIRFGFEKDPFSGINIKNSILRIELQYTESKIAIIDYKSNSVITVNVKYVHQLQNLYFALTGEELVYNTDAI